MEDSICKNCGATLEEGQMFCPKCGTPQKRICSKCGTELKEGQLFCSNCGQKFEDDQLKQKKKTNKKKIPIIIICIIIVLGLVGFGTYMFIKKSTQKDFNIMFPEYSKINWCHISEDGRYMTLDTNAIDLDDFFEQAAHDAIEATNAKLGFSGALLHKMSQTRALDGEQVESNDNYIVSWRYHPHYGLEVTYEIKEK